MHVAQVNVARMLGPIDSPVMAEFVSSLAPINELADRADGFVWRLQGDEGNATAIQVFDDTMLIINMSVWTDINALFQFVYKSGHIEVYRKRSSWFEKMREMHMALWYVDEGHIPTAEEAKQRLEYLRTHGETPHAFTFKSRFAEPRSL